MSRFFLWLAILCFSLFCVFTLVTSFTIVENAQEQWEEREVTPPTATLVIAGLDTFVRDHPFLFTFANILVILLLIYKEQRTSDHVALLINLLFTLIGGALVLFFVCGLPVLLYLPMFTAGPVLP
jgi:hypothetical protein